MAKLELAVLWAGSILAVLSNSSVPVILSCLASISVIIAHWEKVIEFIKKIFKKK